MTDDCRNDCVERLRFPRVVDNRPGLSHIRYRVGSYADIREYLLRNLDKKPGLSHWTHRGADDPGIALLEGASILGDILTFYQELYANEAYLRTAQWRDSIGDLVRLLGYRLSPGLGGQATFAFEIKGNQRVTIPAGFPVKAEVEGLDKPADFETVEPAIAFPWLSRFNVFRPLVQPSVTSATNEFYIEIPDQVTSPVALRQGDRLLVGVGVPSAPGRIDNSEIVIVDSTRVLHGTTLIKIKGALKPGTNATSLVAYKLGRTFRHFGHNGPQTKLVPPTVVTARSTTLASTIQPPPVTTLLQPEPILPPPVTITPDSFFANPPDKTVQLAGNQNVLPSFRMQTNLATDPLPQYQTVFVQVDAFIPTIPIVPLSYKTDIDTVSVKMDNFKVHPDPVTVNPDPVPVPIQSVTVVPPLLPIPPQSITTTTDVVPPTEVSINFFRSLNAAASTATFGLTIIEPNLSSKEFPLDAEVQDLPAGVPVVAQFMAYTDASRTQKEERTVARTIASVKPIKMTWGLLTSTTTLVTLTDSLETPPQTIFYTDIREFEFQETLSPQLTLKAAMQEDLATPQGTGLLFYGTDSQAQNLKGRRVLFEKPGATPFNAVVIAVEADSSPILATRQRVRPITLDTKLTYADFPNLQPVVTVYGNLVDATQGKSEAVVSLGNGDNRLVFQTFKVPKAPVTYLISSSDTPPEVPELQIYVNDRQWKRVPSFFGRRPDEQIYIVREDADNNSWVQFGDGQTGVRLPSGVKNVVARFRTGTGAFGALKAGTKVQAGGKLERLDKIQMPDIAAGGSQPEDGDNARDAAPGKIQSLDRLVSLKDFESEALAISGVTKTAATWQLVDNIPEVVITVLMATGRGAEIDDVSTTLTGYNKGRGPSRFPIRVLSGHRQYVVIDATYGYDSTYREEDVKAAIHKALGVNSGKPNVADEKSGLFSSRQRDFGQREYSTSIAGTIQQVEGVTWVYITRFESLGVIADPTVFTPPIGTAVAESIVACGSQNVLSLYAGHLQIAGVAQTVAEVKQ